MTKDSSHNQTHLTTKLSPVVSPVLESPQSWSRDDVAGLTWEQDGARMGREPTQGHTVMDIKVKPGALTSYRFRTERSHRVVQRAQNFLICKMG